MSHMNILSSFTNAMCKTEVWACKWCIYWIFTLKIVQESKAYKLVNFSYGHLPPCFSSFILHLHLLSNSSGVQSCQFLLPSSVPPHFPSFLLHLYLLSHFSCELVREGLSFLPENLANHPLDDTIICTLFSLIFLYLFRKILDNSFIYIQWIKMRPR